MRSFVRICDEAEAIIAAAGEEVASVEAEQLKQKKEIREAASARAEAAVERLKRGNVLSAAEQADDEMLEKEKEEKAASEKEKEEAEGSWGRARGRQMRKRLGGGSREPSLEPKGRGADARGEAPPKASRRLALKSRALEAWGRCRRSRCRVAARRPAEAAAVVVRAPLPARMPAAAAARP